MTLKNSNTIIYCLISLLNFGQVLNTTTDKEEIKIGEPFTLTYSIVSKHAIDTIYYQPKKEVFNAKTSVLDSDSSDIYKIELLSSFKDTIYQEEDRFIWKGKYKMTAWDSAYIVISPEPILINDSTSFFPPVALSVLSPETNPAVEVYDINEVFTTILDAKNDLKSWLYKYGWLVFVILIIGFIFIYKYTKKKKKGVNFISIEDKTIKAIDELEKSKSYEQNLKEYYFELSVIVRRFLSEYYREQLMGKTTGEIELSLKKYQIDKDVVTIISMLLNQSDMVKFAKSKPPISDVFIITDKARQIVKEIVSNKSEEPKE